MATTLQMPSDHRNDSSMGPVSSQSPAELYARGLPISQLDLKDTRYPTLSMPANSPAMPSSYGSRVDSSPQAESSRRAWMEYSSSPKSSFAPSGWFPDQSIEETPVQRTMPQSQPGNARPSSSYSSRPQPPATPPANTYTATGDPAGYTPISYNPEEQRAQRMSSNSGGSAGVAEPSRTSGVNGITDQSPLQPPPQDSIGQRQSSRDQYRERPPSMIPSTPRHPSLPLAGVGNAVSSAPIVPLSAGPSYNPSTMPIPISSNPRVYPQQPTYINPSSATPVYAPPQVPKEEVCVECAMRDQDMADVDVTSPGVWERESDVLYEDLCRRELDEEASGVSSSDHSLPRPRAKGGVLTEHNLKLWTSVNPKEPSSRMQTLDQYVRAQRSLLESEAIAHARTLRESRQLDDRMRDAYSQLRRSAYELGSSPALTDDSGGVRIKVANSPSVPSGLHGRDVTLLENGMIVEHVDVRKEERERKKEERRERSRARKSSRGSRSADVMSVYSLPIQAYPTDSGFFSNVRPDSRFSQSMSARPSSVLTGGNERPLTMLRAQSQASFSDMQSIGSASSPRRSRFFGLKNLSSGWRSQDSLAPSGSMIDMHVALQREQQFLAAHPQALDLGSNTPTLRLSQSWAQNEPQQDSVESRTTKKSKGLKKIWKLVTGSSSKSAAHANQSKSSERHEDDLPLAPPPPLSYLVNGPRSRHISTPSLPSTNASPNGFMPYGSPPTAPSSLMPSPTSSRPSGVDRETGRDTSPKRNGEACVDQDDRIVSGEYALPESDSRTRSSSRTLSSVNGPMTPATSPSQRPMSTLLSRDKSLPALPVESSIEFPNQAMLDVRPQTVFTYDPNGSVFGLTPPQAPFRGSDSRRQSFGGIGSRPLRASPASVTVGPRPQTGPRQTSEKFNEFGISNMSIGQWAQAQYSQPSLLSGTLDKPKKRKSKFGLGSLFNRKSLHGHPNESMVVAEPLDFSAFRASQLDPQFGGLGGLPLSQNAHMNSMSTYGQANASAPRLSMMSKRNLDLVDQDPDFVAYRYPSNDQRLDLAR